ncbi:hypothetical protein HDU96_010881 [Phlyctochytrium bullatum]|nr:hypothetical protein HDU96_010881 [Phlyctochytrium bullatum]
MADEADTPKPSRRYWCTFTGLLTIAGGIYLTIMFLALAFPHPVQPLLIYLNWINIPLNIGRDSAAKFGFRAGTLRNIRIPSTDGVELGAWHVLPHPTAQSILKDFQPHDDSFFDAELGQADRVFLYFHGNAGNRATFVRPAFYKVLADLGKGRGHSHVIAVDYRGFGDSSPAFLVPTEAGLREDAMKAVQWILSKGVHVSKIFLVGHSLGSGVATYAAMNLSMAGTPAGGLILVAGYASIPDAALSYPMVPLLKPFSYNPNTADLAKSFVRERWETSNMIQNVTGSPILIVHGQRDAEIEIWQARKNFFSAIQGRLGRHNLTVQLPTRQDLLHSNHEANSTAFDNGVYRILPVGWEVEREGRLWLTNLKSTIASRGEVWLLEITYAGHNGIGQFQIYKDTVEEWLSHHNRMEKNGETSKAAQTPARASPKKEPEFMFYFRMAVFLFVIAGTSFCIVMINIPSLLLLLHSHALYRSYVRLTEQIFGSVLVVTTGLLCPETKLVLSGDFDLVKPKNRAILMANHQIYPDWFYLWTFAWLKGCHGDLKILLMQWLSYLPIFGQGMWFFEFIFMKRKWADDKDNLKKHLLKAANKANPLLLLIFPEGTLNTPHNKEASANFAKKNNITDVPKHCLLPKSTGLYFCANILSDTVDDLYDVSVAYSGLTADQVPYDEYLVDKVFFRNMYPREIHLHVEALKLKKVPGFTPEDLVGTEEKRKEDFNLWLREKYLRKDARLDRFYKEGTLILSEEENKNIPKLTVRVAPEIQDYIVILFAWYYTFKAVPVYWSLFVLACRLLFFPILLLFR